MQALGARAVALELLQFVTQVHSLRLHGELLVSQLLGLQAALNDRIHVARRAFSVGHQGRCWRFGSEHQTDHRQRRLELVRQHP
jgi:hypothetical protein